MMEFVFLHTLLSTLTFMLEFVLLYQINTQIKTFFDQEMLGSDSIKDVDFEMFDGK